MRFLPRVVYGLFTIWLAATLAFFALRILPGDAVELQLAQISASEAAKQARRAQLGLDEPFFAQYLRFTWDWIRLDFGHSLYTGLPVSEMIAQRLPNTLQLTALSLCFSALLGLGLGITEGIGAWGIGPTLFIQFALSIPLYWTGVLLLFIATAYLGPIRHSILLPALVLGFHASGAIARLISTAIQEARGADYIRTAYAKGLRRYQVIFNHLLRPSLLPSITLISLQAGFLFGGAIFTESIFSHAGVGLLLLEAVSKQDYPVVQGVVILSAAVYTALNMLADWLYQLLDPRIRVL